MDTQGLLLWLTARALEERNVHVSVDDFVGRKNLQKAVFLLQERGIRYGYWFKWHVYGPYSPKLGTDNHRVNRDMRELFAQEGATATLDPQVVEAIDWLVAVVGRDEKYLEADASAAYLMKEQASTEDDAIKLLFELKPALSELDRTRIRACLTSLRASA